jgi:hypothetical protein
MSFEKKNYRVGLITALATVAGVLVAYLGIIAPPTKDENHKPEHYNPIIIDPAQDKRDEYESSLDTITPPIKEDPAIISKVVKVSGIVVSDNDEPIPGATIRNTCSDAIATTDNSGAFSFMLEVTNKTEDCALIFTKEGFQMERLNIHQFPKTDIVQTLNKLNK